MQRGRRYRAFSGSFGQMLFSVALRSGFVWPSGALFMFKHCFYCGFAAGFVCASWLRLRKISKMVALQSYTGGSRQRGQPLSVGRVQRDRLRHVPAFVCKYNRWKSEHEAPCKQQEIYREIFSRKLNRQNLARTRASRPSFHLAAKAPGGGPPHDIPSSQRAFIAARQKQRSAAVIRTEVRIQLCRISLRT